MSEIENLKIGNGGTLHIVGNEDIIANEWEAGQVYIENRSYVIREHKLLMCNTTHTSVEPFDPDKWTEKNIGEALGTAGSANMIECTLAEYNAWKAGGQLINETVYVITDAPNLNATAKQISYDGGADTVWDKVEAVNAKLSDTATTFTLTYPVLADLNVHGTNCWYNPLTKEVSLDIHLYSASGGIKGANQLIATIPTGKRPNAIINTYCIAVPKDSNLTDLRSEGVFISTDGTIKCNNFILGTDMKYFALQCKYYIV